MKPNNEKEVKEAILKEVNKIAEEEVLKTGPLSWTGKAMWVGGFVAGYLHRVTEVTKQQNGK